MPACALVARKNFILHHSRPDERADQIRNDVAMCCMGCALPCGYCLEASMTDDVLLRLMGIMLVVGYMDADVECSRMAFLRSRQSGRTDSTYRQKFREWLSSLMCASSCTNT